MLAILATPNTSFFFFPNLATKFSLQTSADYLLHSLLSLKLTFQLFLIFFHFSLSLSLTMHTPSPDFSFHPNEQAPHLLWYLPWKQRYLCPNVLDFFNAPIYNNLKARNKLSLPLLRIKVFGNKQTQCFQICFLLLVAGMLGWRRVCRDKMAQFCGIFCLLDLFLIGRWKMLVDFLRCCTLLKLEAREMIKCVGFQCERNPLR